MTRRELLLKNLEPCVDTDGGRQEAYYKGLAENHPTASLRVCMWLGSGGSLEGKRLGDTR